MPRLSRICCIDLVEDGCGSIDVVMSQRFARRENDVQRMMSFYGKSMFG